MGDNCIEDKYLCNLRKGYCKSDWGSRKDMDSHMNNSTVADTDNGRDSSCILGRDNCMDKNNSIDLAPGMNMKIYSPCPDCR